MNGSSYCWTPTWMGRYLLRRNGRWSECSWNPMPRGANSGSALPCTAGRTRRRNSITARNRRRNGRGTGGDWAAVCLKDSWGGWGARGGVGGKGVWGGVGGRRGGWWGGGL